MERTEKKLPFDNTPKPLKRQGFFESRFQNAPSFSSQARYDHFDTAPYSIFDFAGPKEYDFEGFQIVLVMAASIPLHIFK